MIVCVHVEKRVDFHRDLWCDLAPLLHVLAYSLGCLFASIGVMPVLLSAKKDRWRNISQIIISKKGVLPIFLLETNQNKVIRIH